MKLPQIALFGTLLLCSAAPADELYSIRQDQPSIGTSILMDVATSRISFTKRYAELSDAQLKAFRATYRNLPEGDEPPYPADETEKIARDIAQIQQVVQASGNMFLTVDVDAEGNGKKVNFYRMPDPRLAKPVAFALMRAKYKPAKCAGQPCAMQFPFSADFDTQ